MKKIKIIKSKSKSIVKNLKNSKKKREKTKIKNKQQLTKTKC